MILNSKHLDPEGRKIENNHESFYTWRIIGTGGEDG